METKGKFTRNGEEADMDIYMTILITILAIAAYLGVAWRLYHARDEREWRALLDRYADREQAKETFSRRYSPDRPQSKVK